MKKQNSSNKSKKGVFRPKKTSSKLNMLSNEIRTKEGHIKLLSDSLKEKEEEILLLKSEISLLNKKGSEQELISMKQSRMHNISNKKFQQTILSQNNKINEFRGSIVYPLYVITHNFGKTKIGRMFQKILKGR